MIKRCLWGMALRIHGIHHARQCAEIKSITTREQLANFQQKYLSSLFLHAYSNVPYYRGIFDEIDLIRSGKVDLSRFKEIPILTKDTIRKNRAELISCDYRSRKWYYNSSGGSTGKPTRFIQDKLYDKWGNAASYYYYKDILGTDEPSVKKIILWGSERDLFKGNIGWKARLANWATNTLFLNSFMMTEEDMHRYVDTINSYKPDLIRGYAGSLYELCRYAEGKDIKVHSPKLVVSAAEMLSGEMREKIEKVFTTKVYDFYGSREVSGITGECKEGLIHVFNFHNYVEILDSCNQPVRRDEEGRIIITTLHNYSMPLIRYDIGDMAVRGTGKCACGSYLPTLRKITGRITDHFVKRDGTLVSGAALTLTFNLKDWVSNFQIIQEDYEKVRILIVPEGKVDETDQRNVENKLRFIMGQGYQIRWEFVDEIPKTQSGKYLYIKSLVQR